MFRPIHDVVVLFLISLAFLYLSLCAFFVCYSPRTSNGQIEEAQNQDTRAVNMMEGRYAPPQCVHKHVLERIATVLAVPQQACVRRASKRLWEAVRAASLEDLLRAAVLEHHNSSAVDAQLVVVAVSRALGPFPSEDALVAWVGGPTVLYDEVQLRFPHAAAIGISARLAAIRPIPFASGWTVATMCVVTAVASASAPATHAVESFVMGVRNPSVLVSALSHCSAMCPHSVPRRSDGTAVPARAIQRPAVFPPVHTQYSEE